MRKILVPAIMAMAIIAIAGSSGSLWAFDFSADVVSAAEGHSFTGKMYVSGDKTRMDAAGAVTITRIDKNVAWVIMPGQNMYMEQPLDPQSVAGAAEKMPGEIERVLIGPDTVDGKATSKYRIRYVSREGEAVVLQWIDPRTGIPVKTAAEDGSWSMEYKNLKVEKQDDGLFEIPAGYQKFVMPNMQDMMNAAQGERGR